VNPVTVLATFLAVFPAELPDKTMVASVVLSVRFRRPGAVWLGVAAAFLLQCTIAVVAGGLLNLLPPRVVSLGAAVLFAVGAVVLYRGAGNEEELEQIHELEEEPADAPAAAPAGAGGSRWSVMGRSFVVVFLAEWGDLTQLATASMAARTGEPLSVFVGAVAALWAVAAIAVVAGVALARVIPIALVKKLAAVVFALLALYSLVEAIRG
jgi:putative Ca2+/H+ antiporter (TMEM165/GDT1 family)